ncbi:MAG: hypothetical protein GC137_05085 [Alphaproteobacteria bacterium]|nr:hypothetical protein [Alphaproteobacteria bacterium]
MDGNIKVIKKAGSQFEAHAVRGFLESYGIKAFIADEMTLTTHWHLQFALGDMRVLVKEEHYERAQALLKEMECDKKETVKPRSFSNILGSLLLSFVSGAPSQLRKK